MTVPACPLRTGMCYEGTDCDEDTELDLRLLLIWSWGRFPCVCGLLTQRHIVQLITSHDKAVHIIIQKLFSHE